MPPDLKGKPVMAARLFAFESDFVETLRCVPMAVRMKLDRVGIKLTLRQRSRFTSGEGGRLLREACETPEAGRRPTPAIARRRRGSCRQRTPWISSFPLLG